MKTNPLAGLMKINWSSSLMKSLDYGLAIIAIIAGLVMASQWLFWAGVAGIVFAFINPMGRLQGGVRGFIKSKG